MAKILSPFEIHGSVGNTTYFKNEYGQQMKEKGGPTAWQVKNLDRFTNTRLNAAEWKHATGASRLLRHALGDLLRSIKNIRLSGRMNGLLLAVLKDDLIHDYGKRVVSAGNLSKLAGFEFNHHLPLENALPLNIENCFSLEAGKLALDVPAFRIRKKKGIPKDATHYRLVSCILSIDFDKRTYHQDRQVSALHAMGRKAGSAFVIEQVVQPSNEQGCFWLMGIEFYKLVNEQPVLVRGGALRVMEWIASEPRSVGFDGLGGHVEQTEVLQTAVITTAPTPSIADAVLKAACVEEEQLAEAGVKEANVTYMETMEDVLAAAYGEGAKFVETLAEFAEGDDEIAAIREVAVMDEEVLSDASTFEPSLRKLLPMENYKRKSALNWAKAPRGFAISNPALKDRAIQDADTQPAFIEGS
ncbi:MAG: hypothetical protein J7621_05635 [Niastella sp.]|nr:hypothetical protein [Niastella sp.]